MGAFVLGVLVGWLAEWLFFTFWVKGGSNDSSDCESLRSELSTKNNELVALKAELSKVSNASLNVTNATTTKKSVTAKSTTTKKKSVAKVSGTTKSTAPKKTTVKAKKTETLEKAALTTKTKKAKAPKKAVATKKPAAHKKIATAKKATPTVKKVVKKAPAKKAPAKKVAKALSGDDFTKLSGIGPSMSNNLKELGITSYEKLAAMDDDILKDMLEASGAKLNNNKDAMSSWNEQATIAAKGDFSGLKKLQEALKK